MSEYYLNQIWQDCTYAYAATSSGLNVYNLDSTNKVSYIYNIDGFTTIWANDDTIYLGTSSSGIKYILKDTISGSETGPFDLMTSLLDYNFYYQPHKEIKYVHGYEDTLAVVTSSGIDVVNNNINGFKSSFYDPHVTKCFLASDNKLYYIIKGSPSNDGVHRINTTYCDWETPSESYLVGASFIQEGGEVNDIFVTVNTSETERDNTLFIATSNSVYVWDEGTLGFDIYSTK